MCMIPKHYILSTSCEQLRIAYSCKHKNKSSFDPPVNLYKKKLLAQTFSGVGKTALELALINLYKTKTFTWSKQFILLYFS